MINNKTTNSRTLMLAQAGMAHIIGPVIALVIAVIGTSGYVVYQHSFQTVSLSGTITKIGCTFYKPICANYTLKTSNNKTYSLSIHGKVNNTPSGSKVRIIGTSTPANPDVVIVKSIAPISAPTKTQPTTTTTTQPTTTQSSQTSSSVQNPQDPVPSFIKGYVYLTTSGGANCGSRCTPPSPQPYQATIAIQTTSGSPVTTVTSKSSDGSFLVTLVAGTYVLVPQKYNYGLTTAPNQTVTVTQGGTTTVYINYKSNTP